MSVCRNNKKEKGILAYEELPIKNTAQNIFKYKLNLFLYS